MKVQSCVPRLSKLMVATVMAVFGGAAQATLVDFMYNGALAAQLTLTDATNFSLFFKYAPGGSSAKINDLYLAYNPSSIPVCADMTFTNTGTQAMSSECKINGINNQGYTFDWHLNFPTGGNNPDLFVVGDTASWSISPTTLAAWDFELLHINAFMNGQSIKLTGCIDGTEGCTPPPPPPNCTPGVDCTLLPEPGVLSLLGLGLIGLAGFKRRSRAD